MANSTVDKINELLSNSKIVPHKSCPVDAIHSTIYFDEKTKQSNILALSNNCKKSYFSLVKKIYVDVIKQKDFCYDTIDKKFYAFLYHMKMQNRPVEAKDYSRFCQHLQNIPLQTYEVFHKIKGIKITTPKPLSLLDYCIYNYQMHQQDILKELSPLPEQIYEEFQNYDYWISVTVQAKEQKKAQDLAYEKFDLFQSICRFILPTIGSLYYVGILNDKPITSDDYLFFADNNIGFSSHTVPGRFNDIDINSLILEQEDLFNKMLTLACEKESSEISRRILNSILLFGRAEQETLNAQKQLLYIMAIEALLEKKADDIVEMLSNNIAVLFSSTKEHKHKIKSEFKKMYVQRSKITHGSEIYLSNYDVSLAQDYAFNAILQFLLNTEFKNLKRNSELFEYLSKRDELLETETKSTEN